MQDRNTFEGGRDRATAGRDGTPGAAPGDAPIRDRLHSNKRGIWLAIALTIAAAAAVLFARSPL